MKVLNRRDAEAQGRRRVFFALLKKLTRFSYISFASPRLCGEKLFMDLLQAKARIFIFLAKIMLSRSDFIRKTSGAAAGICLLPNGLSSRVGQKTAITDNGPTPREDLQVTLSHE